MEEEVDLHPIAALVESLLDEELDPCDLELGVNGKQRLATALAEVPLEELEAALWTLVELSRRWSEDPDENERAPLLSRDILAVAAPASDRLRGRKQKTRDEVIATSLESARSFALFPEAPHWMAKPKAAPAESSKALLSFAFARRI